MPDKQDLMNRATGAAAHRGLPDAVYHGLFALLAVLAAVFYRERLFIDGGSDMLCMLNREGFCFVHGRYILLFSQWLPVSLLHLDLPLRWVYLGFSLANVLFVYTVFLVDRYWVGNRHHGLAYLLLVTVSIRYSYFAFPMSEVKYGMALVLLVVSLVLHGRHQHFSGKGVLGLALFFILFSHQLVWLALAFALLVMLPAQTGWRNALGVFLPFAFFGGLLVVTGGFGRPGNFFTWAEMSGRLPADWSAATLGREFLLLIRDNIPLWILLLTVTLIYLRAGWTRSLIALWCFLAGAFLLVRNGPGPYILLLSTPVILALVLFLYRRRASLAVTAICFAVFAGGAVNVIRESGYYRPAVKHVEELTEALAGMDGHRFVVPMPYLDNDVVQRFSQYSLLHSAMDGEEGTVMIYRRRNFLNDHSFVTGPVAAGQAPEVVELVNTLLDSLEDQGILPFTELNPEYFPMEDMEYVYVEDSQVQAWLTALEN